MNTGTFGWNPVVIDARNPRPSTSKGVSTPPSCAGLRQGNRNHGERPGGSQDLRARSASVCCARPPPREELETQVWEEPITVACYDVPLLLPLSVVIENSGTFTVCPVSR